MIIVSACLLGENCKYDGKNNLNKAVIEYLKDKSYIAVCPEMLGGLPCPRTPSEIRNGKVYFKDGTDVTEAFLRGADEVLSLLEQYEITEAILKEGSPSCGSKNVYDGTFTGAKIKGQGITAKALSERGIKIRNESEIPEGVVSETE